MVADFHKMAEKRVAEVNENEKDRIHLLIQQYLKTTKTTQFRLSVFSGEQTGLNSMFFRISEQAHKQSVLDFC